MSLDGFMAQAKHAAGDRNVLVQHIELERTPTPEGEDGVTHLHYRVHR